MLNQQPIMVDETTHDLLGPDTYGYMIYRELDLPYIRRWQSTSSFLHIMD